MADLFGLDIASILADGFAAAGGLRPGTLTKVTPGTRTDISGGTNPTETTHTFQGFVEQKAVRRSGVVAADNMSVITILAASISPATVPAVNDTAEIDGTTYTLVELLEEDPASAVFIFAADG